MLISTPAVSNGKARLIVRRFISSRRSKLSKSQALAWSCFCLESMGLHEIHEACDEPDADTDRGEKKQQPVQHAPVPLGVAPIGTAPTNGLPLEQPSYAAKRQHDREHKDAPRHSAVVHRPIQVEDRQDPREEEQRTYLRDHRRALSNQIKRVRKQTRGAERQSQPTQNGTRLQKLEQFQHEREGVAGLETEKRDVFQRHDAVIIADGRKGLPGFGGSARIARRREPAVPVRTPMPALRAQQTDPRCYFFTRFQVVSA